jgi:hypothetical protein
MGNRERRNRSAQEERALSEDDPIFRMYEFAEPIGTSLTNDEMDRFFFLRRSMQTFL